MAGERPLPKPTPETAHFWEGTRAGDRPIEEVAGEECILYVVHGLLHLSVYVAPRDPHQLAAITLAHRRSP